MKYTFIVMLMMMGLLIAAPSKAFAKLNVFACSPEWGALAKEIGGDLVSVYTATKAHQDVHHMRAKPSLLAAMRKADLVFCSGAALESGWLPILLRKAGGPDVQQNTVGWLMASDFVKKIEIMEHVDRSMGHIHPEGNPHVHLNPHNMFDIADTLAERMLLIDQDNALMYDERLKAFKKRWESFILRWEEAAKDLKDKNVVVYHKSWAYLTDWLGMNIIASLEPKPGLPPTAAHLEKLLQTLKGKDVHAILVAPFENDDSANWLSERTNVKVLHLPYTVGGSDTAYNLDGLFSETISLLNGDVE